MLTARSIPLFIHLLGVVTLFIGMGILQRAGVRARAAATIEELRLWLGFARSTRGMFPAALLFILASGLYMTSRSWTFGTPWIVVSMVSILVIGVLGAGVVDRGIAAMAEAATSAPRLTPELVRTAARPGPWVVSVILNVMAIGLLWVMVNKPGWTESIVVVTAFAALGAAAGIIAVRRGGRGMAMEAHAVKS